MTITLDERDRSEILRYLGYRGSEINDVVEDKIKSAVSIANGVIAPKSVWKLYDITKNEEGIALSGSDLVLLGNSIKKHLSGNHKAILFCVTIGREFDREVEKLMVSDPSSGVILNACGIQAVEKLADALQREVEDRLKVKTGVRFSPGYGDLPLELQKDILRELSAEKMAGVLLNRNNLMSPVKSVTAVAGIVEE